MKNNINNLLFSVYGTKQALVGLVLMGVLVHMGCTKDFARMNQNPNGIKDASAQTLLAQTIYSGLVTKIQTAKDIGNELMGYSVTKNGRALMQRFELKNTDGNNLWQRHYRYLHNLEDMYNRAVVEKNVNYQAIALTLKAWLFSELTDTFRDIPYFDALKGDDMQFLPKFDRQEDIYADILAKLDQAALMFNNSVSITSVSDILYGTKTTNAQEITAWRKFCNSLRLRLYLRVSNSPLFNSAGKINEIVSNPATYPIFTNAEDAAYIPFTNIEPLYNPYYNTTSGSFGSQKAPSTTILTMMQAISDPRISNYYTRSVSEYTGVISGYPMGTAKITYPNGTSYVNYSLHDSPRLGVILSYDEVQFILAEAALKGWILGSAETYYLQGIRSNMAFWDKTASTTYLALPQVKYNGTLKQIMEQKYISNFYRGLEAWFDYRRTGYPELILHPLIANNGKVPSRLYYPTVTQIYNPTNYRKAVEKMGGDDINIKSFWEKP